MPSSTWCPKCDARYPGTDRYGHCAVCHETFVGLGAFTAHRVGPYGVPGGRKCQLKPYEAPGSNGKTVYGHWRDERGFIRHGKQLTKEEKEAIFGVRN